MMLWAGVPKKLEFWSDNDRTGVENVTVAVHLFTGPENGKVKKKLPTNCDISTKLLHVMG